ncbi:hypothetical protein [Plantactinospora sp. WMMB782]|uniref:hypothetical protein n=1 Tax=Plantactinospora sp. WMMB782 TaxID=3404121 RepID=UPI003B960EAA
MSGQAGWWGRGGVPGAGDAELDWLAFEQSGVLTSRQAADSLGRATVRGLVRSGRWRAICHDVLLTGNGRLTRDQQLWVAVLAAGRDAVLAGATAAVEAGVRGLRPEPLYVLIPATRQVSGTLRQLPLDMPAVLVRRSTILPDSHLQLARPMRTSVAGHWPTRQAGRDPTTRRGRSSPPVVSSAV